MLDSWFAPFRSARFVDLAGPALVVAVAFGMTGCASTREYTVVVRDPKLVTLLEAPTPARAEDGAPTIAQGTRDGAPWSLVVFREPDGGLRLRCAACSLDATLVGADGIMHVSGGVTAAEVGLERPSPDDVERGALVALPYSYCGFPGRRRCLEAKWQGTRVTPWSNVSQVRLIRGSSAFGSPGVLVTAAGVAAFGALFFLGGLRSDRPGVVASGAIGGGGMLILSAALVKAFFDAKSESVIDSGVGR